MYKLRTMIVQPPDVPACWTELEDQRITPVGGFCRMRLDELPQLLTSSLGTEPDGPRPERQNWKKSWSSEFPITANVTLT